MMKSTAGRRLAQQLWAASQKGPTVALRQQPMYMLMAASSRGVLSQTTPFENSSSSLARRYFSDKKEEATEGAAPKAEAAAEPAEEAAAPLTKEEELTAQNEALEAKVKDLTNSLLRSLAEQENTRSIAKRDVQSGKDFAIKSFAKSLLDVSDNLSRALDAVPQQALEGEEAAVLKTLYEGIDMTDKGLTKAFLMNGLTKFAEQPGDVFNPEMHEALFEYPDPTKEAGTIGQVMKVGFMLNKRVLRPAEVGIVKKP
jgi:molecular chaperone GrpE